MNPSPPDTTERRVAHTTVFQSGNSQAIRIPKEFQFQTKRVELVREGRNIVLRPLAATAAEALLDLPALDATEAQALAVAMSQIDDLPALDEPEWTAQASALVPELPRTPKSP